MLTQINTMSKISELAIEYTNHVNEYHRCITESNKEGMEYHEQQLKRINKLLGIETEDYNKQED